MALYNSPRLKHRKDRTCKKCWESSVSFGNFCPPLKYFLLQARAHMFTTLKLKATEHSVQQCLTYQISAFNVRHIHQDSCRRLNLNLAFVFICYYTLLRLKIQFFSQFLHFLILYRFKMLNIV